MKQIVAILLALVALLSLCACGEDPTDSNTNLTVSNYSVEAQEMFRFEGLCVSVIPGTYSADPEFHVTNTSDRDLWVVLDAIAYDDVLQSESMGNAGTVYKVLAGADQKLSACESFGSAVFQYVVVMPDGFFATGGLTDATSGTGVNMSFSANVGNIVTFATGQAANKREYRFAVYSIDPDVQPETGKSFVPDAKDLLYRSDLILLQSSGYDASKVSKQLPTEDPLFSYQGIKIWRNSDSSTVIGPAGTALQLPGFTSFVIDNASNVDVRVEILLTPDPSQPSKDVGKDDGDKETGQDPASYFLSCEIPAGKASRNVNSPGNSKIPSWLDSGSLIVDIRIFDLVTGDLMLESSVTAK